MKTIFILSALFLSLCTHVTAQQRLNAYGYPIETHGPLNNGGTTSSTYAEKGALYTAGIGAVIGHQSGHTKEGALIGLAVGYLGGKLKDSQIRNQQQTRTYQVNTPVHTRTSPCYDPELENARLAAERAEAELRLKLIQAQREQERLTALENYRRRQLAAEQMLSEMRSQNLGR